MKNKELLYVLLGVAVLAGFYFWNKKQKQKTYSKECWDSLNGRLLQQDAKPPNFEKDFLESCVKSEKK
jgi:hypothetical protein